MTKAEAKELRRNEIVTVEGRGLAVFRYLSVLQGRDAYGQREYRAVANVYCLEPKVGCANAIVIPLKKLHHGLTPAR